MSSNKGSQQSSGEQKIFKSSAVLFTSPPAAVNPSSDPTMATMAMHNAPPVPNKPGQQQQQQQGGQRVVNQGQPGYGPAVSGQPQQTRAQYNTQQSGGQNTQQHFQGSQAFNAAYSGGDQFPAPPGHTGQQTTTTTTVRSGGGPPQVSTSTINFGGPNNANTTHQQQQSVNSQQHFNSQQTVGQQGHQQNNYQQQHSGNQQQQSYQTQHSQQQQQNHQQHQQQNYQQQQSFNQQQQIQNNQQQLNQQHQSQNQFNQQQQRPAPGQPPRPQQPQTQSRPQPHQNGGVPQTNGGSSAPGFLQQKKHFQANQTTVVEWKNKSMRRVERSNSFAMQEQENRPQQDSDEDGILPEFTSNVHDIVDLKEGERAHFDCCLAPQLVGDSSMKITWTKDGQQIQSSNRFLIQESFGRLSLDILGVRQEDQGTYQVLVSNSAGDAASQGQLKVLAARAAPSVGASGQFDSASRFIPEDIRQEQSTERPSFSELLAESLVVEEGEPLRLQATLQPANDSLMKVEWVFNNRPLLMGSRLATFYDFGLVTLSILDTRAEDSGVYTLRARNSLGQVESSCKLTCQTRGKSTIKPMFQEPLVANPASGLNEGDYVHLETRIEPRNDAYIVVEWLHNGRLIQTGQRLRPHYDFGIATLDIVGAYPEDSGEFTVRASNSLGSDTTSVSLQVAGKPGLLLDTQHPEGLAKIADLEYKDFSREFTYNDVSKHEPRFVEQLPRLPDFNEGDKLRLEAQVEPRGDPNMKVEWFVNGRSVNNGHRTRTVFDFGFASLDVLDIQTRDAGEYVMRATNPLGTAESKTFLKVIGKGGINFDPQYAASLDKIRDLEAYENGPGYIPDNIQEDKPTAAPTFVEGLQPVPEMHEGASIHLECTINPPNDPTLQLEWYLNGRPLHTGSRFRPFNDFGAVGLDILSVIPEDSGEYTVKATNALGSNTSSTMITVRGRASIILEAQAPGGAEKVRELEEMLNYKPEMYIEEQVHSQPVFVKQLTGPSGKVKEGSSMHLECQVQPVNDPSLRIEWFFNGQPLNTGTRCRFTHDLEYVALDMNYVFPRDAGEYAVKVTNSLGSAVSATPVYCYAKKNIITESQNPRALKKIQDLEAWNL